MPYRYNATLDGMALDIEHVTDRGEKALGVHEYPFSDHVDIDDLGMRANAIRYRCYFLDEAYDDHFSFLEHIRETQVNELIHPIYGIKRGYVKVHSIESDDRIQTAEIEIEFVESSGAYEAASEERVVMACEQHFVDGQEDIAAEVAATLYDDVGAVAGDLVNADLDASQTVLSQMSGLSWKARGIVKNIDSDISSMRNTLSSIENPATSVIATVNYGTGLGGMVASELAQTVERYAESIATTAAAPSRFISALRAGVADFKNSLGYLGNTLTIQGALLGAVKVAEMYDGDEQNRNAVRQAESTKAFAADGTFLRRAPLPAIYTINELENSLSAVREYIQEAINVSRLSRSLQSMARSLLRHVNNIKLERYRIISVTITSPMPMHAVCHKYNLPYAYADRLVSLNPAIKNPSFVEGDILIYAR